MIVLILLFWQLSDLFNEPVVLRHQRQVLIFNLIVLLLYQRLLLIHCLKGTLHVPQVLFSRYPSFLLTFQLCFHPFYPLSFLLPNLLIVLYLFLQLHNRLIHLLTLTLVVSYPLLLLLYHLVQTDYFIQLFSALLLVLACCLDTGISLVWPVQEGVINTARL